MHITDNNTLYFTDDQASNMWGDNWVDDIRNTDGHMFLDGIEYYAHVRTGVFNHLELEPVYEINLEELYN